MNGPDRALDHGLLAAEIERGVSLPAPWYTDAAVAAREPDRIFRWTWQYVGRSEQITQVGD